MCSYEIVNFMIVRIQTIGSEPFVLQTIYLSFQIISTSRE